MDVLNPPLKNNVKRLERICLKFIVSHFSKITNVIEEEFLYEGLADDFLLKLCKTNQLTSNVLPYLNPEFMQLTNPVIVNQSKNGIDDFSFLTKFNLRSLSIVSVDSVSPKYILGCLNLKTVNSLVHLSLCRFKTQCGDIHRVHPDILAPFENLQSLNISGMNFNDNDLSGLTCNLPHLLYLNISNTKVTNISSVRYLKQLKGLYMYFKSVVNDIFITLNTVIQLSNLIELDISINPIDEYDVAQKKILIEFLKSSSNPNLEYLNISGLGHVFSVSNVRTYLDNHTKLHCLVASSMYIDVESDLQEYGAFTTSYPDVEIICNMGDNLLKVLKNFRSRPLYIKNALHAMFSETASSLNIPRAETLRIVLKTVQSYEFKLALHESPRFQTDLLMVFTAVLYNLISKCAQDLPPHLTREALSLVLQTLESPYTNTVVQKNALLCICNDPILTSVKFEHKKCCDLIFKCIKSSSSEQYIMQLGLCIVSSLAAEMTLQEVSDLSVYIDCLLLIVAEWGLNLEDTDDIPWLDGKISGNRDFSTVNLIMGFSLGALWNFTDECEAGCKKFIEYQGLDIYYKLFRNYEVNEEVKRQVYTKCLGLLNNFAEVPSLRKDLLGHGKLTGLFLDLLNQSSVTVRYFAAGIISHLVCEPDSEWLKYFGQSKQRYNQKLYDALITWELAQDDMVAYRSFKPFEALIQHPESTRGVWLWALWAIRHVVNLREDRYIPYLLTCPQLLSFIERHAHMRATESMDLLNKIAYHLWHEKVHKSQPNEVIRDSCN